MRRLPLVALASLLAALPAAAADGPPPPPAGPSVERRLHFAAIEASSILFNDWNQYQENYHPNYVGDDDPATAWVEGAKGSGAGEWIRVRVTPMQGATRARLRLRNGYQKSDRLFKANARARAVTVVLLPSKVTVERELTDSQGWQELTVDQPSGPLEAVELRIKSVYAGNKYEDLCLSDAQLFVTATTLDNPLYERTHLTKLLGWKKSRLEAAKLFKEASAKTLPVAPQYSVERRQDAEMRWDQDPLLSAQAALERLAANAPTDAAQAQAQRWRALLTRKAFGANFTPAQVVVKDKRPLPTVDGLCQKQLPQCASDPCTDALPLPPQLGWLSTAQLGVFDVTTTPSLQTIHQGKPMSCTDRHQEGLFAWVHRLPGSDGKPRVDALLIARCSLVESREGWDPSSLVQLLGYDEHGRLILEASEDSSGAWLRWSDDGTRAGGVHVRDGVTLDVKRAEVAKR